MVTSTRNESANGSLWDKEKARVSRRAFSDRAIQTQEIEKIFNKSWLVLGHESEIPNPTDYVVRPMGDDQVIVNRGEDGVVRAFLNACRHRGVQLCRADAGKARRFVCPYHAWAYDTTGALRTTSYDQHYDKAGFAELGLTPVARLEIYKGLIFASWNPDVEPLEDHLGDLRYYIDMLFGRTPGGMKVLGPPQRWVIETNWKITALNFIDSQHAIRTHVGPLNAAHEAGAPSLPELVKFVDASPQVTFPQGHGVVSFATPPGAPPFLGYPQDLIQLYEEALSPQQFAHLRDLAPQVGTIFPNTSWVEPLLVVDPNLPPAKFLGLHNWQPLGPDRIEVWCWYFAEAEASEEWCAQVHKIALQTFGIGGIFDEDDAEAWAAISRAIKGPIASCGYMDFSAGKGTAPIADYPAPGTAYLSNLLECSQANYMSRWDQMMTRDQVQGDVA